MTATHYFNSFILYFMIFSFHVANSNRHHNRDCYSSFIKNCCKGYHLIDGECIPICQNGCPESYVCLRPNVCEYETPEHKILKLFNKPMHQFIEFIFYLRRADCVDLMLSTESYCGNCYPTYVSVNNKCQPYCEQNCINGFCESPGVCQCNANYYQDSKTNKCELIQKCDNESCQNFEITTKDFTYQDTVEISASDDGITTSSSTEMINSSIEENTSEPIFKEDENFTISPTLDVTSNCQNGCWGGICVEGICQCKEGLILNIESNDCIMPCESTCQNGVCNQDKICECNQGYVYEDHSGCVPQCDRKCVNGFCVSPSHCECLEGDISMLNISSVLQCLPTCEGIDGTRGCLNGTCVAINKCQCFSGFVPNPYDRYECVVSLSSGKLEISKNFLYLMWIVGILTFSTIIVIGCLAYKRIRCVSYNIAKIEKLHSTIVFQNHEQQQLVCIL